MKVLEYQKPQTNDATYCIVEDSLIEKIDYSQIRNQYGQMEGDFQDLEIESVEYHDGCNYRSAVICDGIHPHPEFKEIDNTNAAEILAALESAEYGDDERGIKTAETEKFTFVKSRWQSFGIDVICK
jgi:hypothetical protein